MIAWGKRRKKQATKIAGVDLLEDLILTHTSFQNAAVAMTGGIPRNAIQI